MKKIPVLLLFLTSSLQATTLVIDGFGSHGWNSWDTRDSAGGHLFGEHFTHSGWLDGGSVTAGDDDKIAGQIKFLGEGLGAATAAGTVPNNSPVGSLNGLGYVRLDGTVAETGKSDLSYVDLGGIAPSPVLLDPGFSATYRYYSDSFASTRRPGLNIELTGTNGHGYVFVFVQPNPFSGDVWNTVTATAESQFYLYGGGGTPNGSLSRTLAGWSEDATWGALLFGENAEIFRVGFNVGSSQRNGLVYLDWVQTSLLNGGDLIDFQAVQAIPEPGTTALFAGGLAFAALIPLRRRFAQ